MMLFVPPMIPISEKVKSSRACTEGKTGKGREGNSVTRENTKRENRKNGEEQEQRKLQSILHNPTVITVCALFVGFILGQWYYVCIRTNIFVHVYKKCEQPLPL